MGNGGEACYEDYVAYFTKKGLNKSNVLHELYNHLVYVKGLDVPEKREEKDAETFSKDFLNKYTHDQTFLVQSFLPTASKGVKEIQPSGDISRSIPI